MTYPKCKQVRLIAEDLDVCLLWVSGLVTHMEQVVSWVGGFIVPTHDKASYYSMMKTTPAGDINGDIIVILADDTNNLDANYDDVISSKLKEWGI